MKFFDETRKLIRHSTKREYSIFSLPYAFPDLIVITTDIMDIQFNQTGYQLIDLVPMLFAKIHEVSVHVGQNEKLTSSFINLLKQRTHRGKS